jgi:peptide subunit release factor RF-3
MASNKRAKKDATAAYDAERLAKFLSALPLAPCQNPDDAARVVLSDIKFAINWYHDELALQKRQPDPDDRSLNDMRKAAADLAANIRRFGVRNFPRDLVTHSPRPESRSMTVPHLEGLLADLDRFAAWMAHHQARLKRRTTDRVFVGMVIGTVERFTDMRVKRSTKPGAPAAEGMRVLNEIIAIVAPHIGPGTIDETVKVKGSEIIPKW